MAWSATDLLSEACTLAATRALPVGAHLSVPIRLADGSVYGTFCCFSRRPDHSLGDRDLRIMRVFAELVAEHMNRELREREREIAAHARVDAAMRDMQMVFQPICEVSDGRVVGFEALARFPGSPELRPDECFADATFIDRGIPVLVGEYGATHQAGYEDYRRYYMEYVTKAAVQRGLVPVYWDNGGQNSGGENFGLFDRRSGKVLHPAILEAMLRATSETGSLSEIRPPRPTN